MKTKGLYLLLYVIFGAVQQIDSVEVENSLKNSDSENPMLLKILQSVDAATSDEHLFEVTLKLLKGICACMNAKYGITNFNGDINSLQSEDESKNSKRRELDLYKTIYKNTCFSLRQELAKELNSSQNVTLDDNVIFWGKYKCGKRFDITTERVILASTSSQPILHDNIRLHLQNILFQALIQTKRYHSYSLRKSNLFGKAIPWAHEDSKHSIIVILTLHTDEKEITDNFHQEIDESELNKTLNTNSQIDIDIIDTRYSPEGDDKKEKNDNVLECTLQSVYTFLVESEKNNLTKVFKLLRKNRAIKVYIEVITNNNHTDYSNICCKNGAVISSCDKFVNDNFEHLDSDEVYKQQRKKYEKITTFNTQKFKDTISKIKNLVNLYDRKLKQIDDITTNNNKDTSRTDDNEKPEYDRLADSDATPTTDKELSKFENNYYQNTNASLLESSREYHSLTTDSVNANVSETELLSKILSKATTKLSDNNNNVTLKDLELNEFWSNSILKENKIAVKSKYFNGDTNFNHNTIKTEDLEEISTSVYSLSFAKYDTTTNIELGELNVSGEKSEESKGSYVIMSPEPSKDTGVDLNKTTPNLRINKNYTNSTQLTHSGNVNRTEMTKETSTLPLTSLYFLPLETNLTLTKEEIDYYVDLYETNNVNSKEYSIMPSYGISNNSHVNNITVVDVITTDDIDIPRNKLTNITINDFTTKISDNLIILKPIETETLFEKNKTNIPSLQVINVESISEVIEKQSFPKITGIRLNENASINNFNIPSAKTSEYITEVYGATQYVSRKELQEENSNASDYEENLKDITNISFERPEPNREQSSLAVPSSIFFTTNPPDTQTQSWHNKTNKINYLQPSMILSTISTPTIRENDITEALNLKLLNVGTENIISQIWTSEIDNATQNIYNDMKTTETVEKRTVRTTETHIPIVDLGITHQLIRKSNAINNSKAEETSQDYTDEKTDFQVVDPLISKVNNTGNLTTKAYEESTEFKIVTNLHHADSINKTTWSEKTQELKLYDDVFVKTSPKDSELQPLREINNNILKLESTTSMSIMDEILLTPIYDRTSLVNLEKVENVSKVERQENNYTSNDDSSSQAHTRISITKNNLELPATNFSYITLNTPDIKTKIFIQKSYTIIDTTQLPASRDIHKADLSKPVSKEYFNLSTASDYRHEQKKIVSDFIGLPQTVVGFKDITYESTILQNQVNGSGSGQRKKVESGLPKAAYYYPGIDYNIKVNPLIKHSNKTLNLNSTVKDVADTNIDNIIKSSTDSNIVNKQKGLDSKQLGQVETHITNHSGNSELNEKSNTDHIYYHLSSTEVPKIKAPDDDAQTNEISGLPSTRSKIEYLKSLNINESEAVQLMTVKTTYSPIKLVNGQLLSRTSWESVVSPVSVRRNLPGEYDILENPVVTTLYWHTVQESMDKQETITTTDKVTELNSNQNPQILYVAPNNSFNNIEVSTVINNVDNTIDINTSNESTNNLSDIYLKTTIEDDKVKPQLLRIPAFNLDEEYNTNSSKFTLSPSALLKNISSVATTDLLYFSINSEYIRNDSNKEHAKIFQSLISLPHGIKQPVTDINKKTFPSTDYLIINETNKNEATNDIINKISSYSSVKRNLNLQNISDTNVRSVKLRKNKNNTLLPTVESKVSEITIYPNNILLLETTPKNTNIYSTYIYGEITTNFSKNTDYLDRTQNMITNYTETANSNVKKMGKISTKIEKTEKVPKDKVAQQRLQAIKVTYKFPEAYSISLKGTQPLTHMTQDAKLPVTTVKYSISTPGNLNFKIQNIDDILPFTTTLPKITLNNTSNNIVNYTIPMKYPRVLSNNGSAKNSFSELIEVVTTKNNNSNSIDVFSTLTSNFSKNVDEIDIHSITKSHLKPFRNMFNNNPQSGGTNIVNKSMKASNRLRKPKKILPKLIDNHRLQITKVSEKTLVDLHSTDKLMQILNENTSIRNGVIHETNRYTESLADLPVDTEKYSSTQDAFKKYTIKYEPDISTKIINVNLTNVRQTEINDGLNRPSLKILKPTRIPKSKKARKNKKGIYRLRTSNPSNLNMKVTRSTMGLYNAVNTDTQYREYSTVTPKTSSTKKIKTIIYNTYEPTLEEDLDFDITLKSEIETTTTSSIKNYPNSLEIKTKLITIPTQIHISHSKNNEFKRITYKLTTLPVIKETIPEIKTINYVMEKSVTTVSKLKDLNVEKTTYYNVQMNKTKSLSTSGNQSIQNTLTNNNVTMSSQGTHSIFEISAIRNNTTSQTRPLEFIKKYQRNKKNGMKTLRLTKNLSIALQKNFIAKNLNNTTIENKIPTLPYDERNKNTKFLSSNMKITPRAETNNHNTEITSFNNKISFQTKSINYETTTFIGKINKTLLQNSHITTSKNELNKTTTLFTKQSDLKLPIMKSTISCEYLRHHVYKTVKELNERLRAANCTEETIMIEKKKIRNEPSINLVNNPVRTNKHITSFQMLKNIEFVNSNRFTQPTITTATNKPNIKSGKQPDTSDNTNLYPIKILPQKTQRKIMKRIKVKNKDIMTMNTNDFFSQKRFGTNMNNIKEIPAVDRRPFMINNLRTPVTRPVILRPKFNSKGSGAGNPPQYFHIPQPIYTNNDEFGIKRNQHNSVGLSWRNKPSYKRPPFAKEEPLVSNEKKFTENVLDKPLYFPQNPKASRDKTNYYRDYVSYVTPTTLRSLQAKNYLVSPFDVKEEPFEPILYSRRSDLNADVSSLAKASILQGPVRYKPLPVYHKTDNGVQPTRQPAYMNERMSLLDPQGFGWNSGVLSTEAPLTKVTTWRSRPSRRSRRTIFFLSPTIPYDTGYNIHYF